MGHTGGPCGCVFFALFLASAEPRIKCNRVRPGPVVPSEADDPVTPTDDLADIEKVLAGDTSAFEGIVRRWQSPLINMAYRYCRDRGRAEDMAQQAFLKAYRGLAQWRRDAAFSTWLFALAANLYRSELRRIPVYSVRLDEIAEPRDPNRADSVFDVEERERLVRNAVLSLPEKYRDAVILFYFHEMDIPAAARSMRLPEGTVKARLFRGRELLRDKLDAAFAAPRLKEAT